MKTRITEMLGIKYPILQGGMVHIAEPPLAAAVSNAGGLGILTGSLWTPDELAEKIRQIKMLTEKPFALNFTPTCENLEENLEVCIREKVTAVTYGRGRHTTDLVSSKLWPHGIISIPVVATVKQAQRVETEGAHAVIISGLEGGGHVSRVTTMVVLPQVTAKVKIPVIAAGGFADGRGLAAALALGAEAIQIGTRFLCTRESLAHHDTKNMLLRAGEEDTLVTGQITGLRIRVLKNKLTEAFEDLEERKAPAREFDRLGLGKLKMGLVDGDINWGSVPAGQVVGMIEDVPTCEGLIARIMDKAEKALMRMNALWADT
ncbi:nitronate monooxygenase [Thermodesulfobacteriota bacterium]